MMSTFRHHKTLIALSLVVFFGVAVFLPRRSETPKVNDWAKMIQEEGPTKAYANFALVEQYIPPTVQHQDAHIFGRALYATQGLNGFNVCGDLFNFGCAHEVLGEAISEHGLSAIPSLSGRCDMESTEDRIQCLHGVGHGILAYMGYSEVDLKKALHVCPDTSLQVAPWGCYEGVFMEYNFRTMADTSNRTPLDADIFAPCDTFSGAQERSCMFWAPHWLAHTVFQNATSTVKFEKLGQKCDKVDPNVRVACFGGIGYVAAAEAQFEPERVIQNCIASSDVPSLQGICRTCAARVVDHAITQDSKDARPVCDGLLGKMLTSCEQTACMDVDIR